MNAIGLYARIGLLLLLAVLLPVRGAVAAAMLCGPGGASGTHHELRTPGPAAASEAMDATMAHGHHSASHHAASTQPGEDDAGGSPADTAHAASDKCNLCSACCSLTPLVSAVPTVPEPQALAAISFPDRSVPPPSFLSDGQERPPRTR